MVVLLASNTVLLANVGWNRSGEVVQRMTMGERELPIVGAGYTGVRVHLEAQLYGGNLRHSEVIWDHAASRFAELGFDDSFVWKYGRDLPARELFLVAEYKGPAWQEWARIPWEASQLIRVDAGKDPDALRGRYPDQKLYLIVPGRMSAPMVSDQVTGFTITTEILLTEIHVPQPYARLLVERGKRAYRLTLCYGKRYEPWVCGVTLE